MGTLDHESAQPPERSPAGADRHIGARQSGDHYIVWLDELESGLHRRRDSNLAAKPDWMCWLVELLTIA
jgi:hypothetical protein